MEIMPLCLGDNSVDLIMADLPFGCTQNEWDESLDLSLLWAEYKRIAKPNAAILLNGQGKFSAELIMSNPKEYRYDWVWEKTNASGFLNANRMPLRAHEQILVFYRELPTYNPQKTKGHARKRSVAAHKKDSNYGNYGPATYDSTERYPRSVLKFPADKQKSALHPTQKPVALIEYFIRTYTNEGALVLDNCAGSGTAGEACRRSNRNCILIEKDPKSIKIIKERLHVN